MTESLGEGFTARAYKGDLFARRALQCDKARAEPQNDIIAADGIGADGYVMQLNFIAGFITDDEIIAVAV